MSKKEKLLARLLERPKDYGWDDVCTLMKQCGFERYNASGSARMFMHVRTRQKVRLHEPHPEKTLKRYMVDQLIQALTDAGEIQS